MKLRCAHCNSLLSKVSPTTIHTRQGRHFCDSMCLHDFGDEVRHREWELLMARLAGQMDLHLPQKVPRDGEEATQAAMR